MTKAVPVLGQLLSFSGGRRLSRRTDCIGLSCSDEVGFVGVAAEGYRCPPVTAASPEQREAQEDC